MRKIVTILATLAVGFGVAVSGVNATPAEAAVSSSAVKSQPLTSKYKISSGYGYRVHPVTKRKGTFHRGIDYPSKCGSNIVSSMDGTVYHNAYDKNGWGHYIVVKNGKFATLYAHMKSKSPLKKGAKVYRGQRLGYVGKTGMATGCHLHFEFRDQSKSSYGYFGKDFNPTSRMKNLPYFKSPVTTKGAIGTYYKKNKSKTGDPTTNEGKIKTPTGAYQRFDKGTVYHSKSSGAHLNKGAIRKAYAKQKYTKGKLGYPTSDEFKKNGKIRQNFKKGYITWSSKQGAKVYTK